MWPSLLILIASLPLANGEIPASSVGPTSTEEAKILWTEGQRSYSNHDYTAAITKLKRLVDRYPSAPGFTDAHLLLGRSYLKTGKAKLALKPLHYYVTAKGHSAESADGKESLAEAFLQTGKFSEAQFTANEILSPKTNPASTPSHKISALILRARAWINLDRHKEAQESISSARQEFVSYTNDQRKSEFATKLAKIELELKTRECGQLPSRGRLNEGQIQEQISRRGDCLLEAELILKQAWEGGNADVARQASELFISSFKQYAKACAAPPRPPGARTAQQLKQYKKELTIMLRRECQAKQTLMIDFINQWLPRFTGHISRVASKTGQKIAEIEI